ncbi:MAG: peptide chain release factor N(5)-glutamine methyltransferase [Verrucomicrobiota bacterium]
MLSLREVKQRTEKFFRDRGVPDSKLDTDLLLAHALGIKRLEIYLDLERPLTEAQLDFLRPLVKRRADREPIQYILGSVEFCGLTLMVDQRALIPRPETEELIELIESTIESPPSNILDLGTGTGAIALALAHKYPEAEVTAVDACRDTLDLAAENARNLVSENRIQFVHGSWFQPLANTRKFDLIVSNPPYLTEAEMDTAEPEIVSHEPSQALVSGKDGLNDLRIILANALQFLTPGGLIALETGINHHEKLDELSKEGGLTGKSYSDLSGRSRFYLSRVV